MTNRSRSARRALQAQMQRSTRATIANATAATRRRSPAAVRVTARLRRVVGCVRQAGVCVRVCARGYKHAGFRWLPAPNGVALFCARYRMLFVCSLLGGLSSMLIPLAYPRACKRARTCAHKEAARSREQARGAGLWCTRTTRTSTSRACACTAHARTHTRARVHARAHAPLAATRRR
jgi:hypothetical protein